MASSLLNGERTVVMLFIGVVLVSTPSSLLLPASCLLILALFALAVEVSAEVYGSVGQFKTRPGASSGILLGAVTLPAAMLSKLIQLSRAYLLHEIEFQELQHLMLQYWEASACCFSVLIFLCLVLRHSPNTQHDSRSRFHWSENFGISCTILYIVLCSMSFAAVSLCSLHAAVKLLWVFCHGLVAVKLIHHILYAFPSCASIGEALLVTVGLVLYFGDMLTCTIAKIHGHVSDTELAFASYGVKRSEITIIIQGLLLGLLLLLVFFKLVQLCRHFTSSSSIEANRDDGIERSIVFYVSLTIILTFIVPSWMQFVQDFDVHPLLWVLKFVLSEPLKRLSLCIYWVAVIYMSVSQFYDISKHSKIERILLRKYYHLVAVLMFLPALLYQPKFLDLAFGAALALFMVLEIIRVWRIWPLGQVIHQFMNAFTDHRDSELLIVSHFSLLLGCALPIWMSSGYNDRPLAPFAGILSLGIGDTMASMVGHKYGVLRWSKSGKKTIEGTAAGITSVLVACSVLLPLLASTGYILSQHWFFLLVSVTVSGLLEAYTAQLDNAFIPLIFYSLLCL